MKKVHLLIKRRWKYIELPEELFQMLYDIEVITYTNCVYALKLYTKDCTPIILSFPKNREFMKEDFKIQTSNGEYIPLL